ncbi:GTPase, G3E family [Butyrivibrio sp. ob235]|uniref:GTP-binding protein n=1 Tax=Butyrivibrio sp. ob235 TaxID=1761780 RepID=UPI0008C2233E|nr:GTP-binding protein [Butyrivibrio sp. ob235]SEL48721.1 GTPase, G3E family [Butyrivibrio sp. ob235]
MVKIDLITGFLGSGKTTFIREYSKYLLSQGERICIIENDYGAVNIDMVLLQDLFGENCNLEMIVGGDGQEAHRRRFRTKLISMGMSGYTRVIIEPSGIYDVDEFFDVLYDEPLDRWYEIGNVISIVDGSSVSSLEGMSRYLFMSEIAHAGKIVVSKISDGMDVPEVISNVNSIMSEFGLGKENSWFDPSKDFITKHYDEFTETDFKSLAGCGYRHASYVKLPLEDKQFTPLFYFDVEISEDNLRKIAGSLFKDTNAGKVIRIKGFVKTGDNSQIEFNATENEMKIAPVVSSRNVLIIIGEALNKEYINSILKDYCKVVSL